MPRSRTIAIVESSPSERLALAAKLENDYRVATFASVESGTPALADSSVDLCVTRLEWEEASPAEICRRWRASGIRLPIIGVASELDESRCVAALDAGADDVVLRTVGIRELVARIEAVLRRCGQRAAVFTYYEPSFSFSFDEMSVIVDGRRIALSLGEARLLAALLADAGLPLPSRRLEAVMSAHGPPVRSATVTAQLRSLRRKIGPGRIETRIGVGYAFVPRVSQRG